MSQQTSLSNFDRIKNMTAEVFADFLDRVVSGESICRYCIHGGSENTCVCDYVDCDKMTLEQLCMEGVVAWLNASSTVAVANCDECKNRGVMCSGCHGASNYKGG